MYVTEARCASGDNGKNRDQTRPRNADLRYTHRPVSRVQGLLAELRRLMMHVVVSEAMIA